MDKQYLCIDLKSFYASVECVERGLDPLSTNLVVADAARTDKTICLAVSPSLKKYGIPGRPRLFEVKQKLKEANVRRRSLLSNKVFYDSSYDAKSLEGNPHFAIDYITAPPRMALYVEYSTRIYQVYLRHVAPEDIHVYSIDEVFMDLTPYLIHRGKTAHEMAIEIIRDVLKATGITATAGIGTNLYLAKVAMDITAKKMPADKDGVRIAELNEISYRETLWDHRPLTDFWRIGHGYASKLEAHGLYTMGDIARCSMGKDTDYYNESLLYKLFGVNAELLIDHAWGWEPCTIADIKAYKPSTNSISSGQVLHCPYSYDKARVVVQEMADLLSLDLVDKKLATDQIVLTIGYDIENLSDTVKAQSYKGDVVTDYYGRKVPKHAHGTVNLKHHTSSGREIIQATLDLYDRITNRNLLVRRITLNANRVIPENQVSHNAVAHQLDLFTDYEMLAAKEKEELENREREKRLQTAILSIKKKHGKNMILKGMNYQEGATAKDRNRQIGGHRA